MVADDLDRDPTEEERDALIEKIAGGVHRKHMHTAAVLFLELHKPLAFIGSQALIVGSPFVGPFVGIENVHRVSKLLAERDNIERLILRIEELANEPKAVKEG